MLLNGGAGLLCDDEFGGSIVGLLIERLVLGHTQDLFRSGDAFAHESPAVFGQRSHVASPGRVTDDIARDILQDELAYLVVAVHPLENRAPSMVTGVAALAAAHGTEDRNLGRKIELDFNGLSGG